MRAGAQEFRAELLSSLSIEGLPASSGRAAPRRVGEFDRIRALGHAERNEKARIVNFECHTISG
jgi:hypothetical protein